MPNANQRFVSTQQIGIDRNRVRRRPFRAVRKIRFRRVGQIIPHHRLAAAGIVRAPHPDFIAVIDHRSSDVGHQKQRDQFLNLIFFRRRLARGIRRILNRFRGGIVGAPIAIALAVWIHDMRRDAVRVVAVHEILLNVGDAGIEGFAQIPQQSVEFRRGNPFLLIDEIIGAGKRDIVIHHRVEFVALKIRPQFVNRIDQFRREIGFRVERLDELAPRFPERMFHAGGHV